MVEEKVQRRIMGSGEEIRNGGKNTVSSTTKLPKLKITPFKGTASDWVRFHNMFLTQVDAKSISNREIWVSSRVCGPEG